MPPGGRCEILEDIGHFVHIERPELDAMVLDSSERRREPRSRCCATARSTWRCTTCADAPSRRRDPLLLLHGLGEALPEQVPAWAAAWPGPVYALDFTGHGASTFRGRRLHRRAAPRRRGRRAAALPWRSRPVDHRRRSRSRRVHRAPIAGGRAAQVRGAILVDGPGLAGGPTGPTSQSFFSLPSSSAPPDPYALVELARDLRPPDYATLFVRLALAGSELEEPIAVASVFRPEWLDAVAASTA